MSGTGAAANGKVLQAHLVAMAGPVHNEEHAHVVHGQVGDGDVGAGVHRDAVRELAPELQQQNPTFLWASSRRCNETVKILSSNLDHCRSAHAIERS